MATLPPAEGAPAQSAAAHRGALDDEVQYVKGVGPAAARILANLNIHTVGDVLRHVPFRYEDRRSFRRIADLSPGEPATICGRAIGAENVPSGRRKLMLTRVLLDDGSGVAQLTFFNQPYLQRRFDEMARSGRAVVAYGTPRRAGYGPIELDHPEWEDLADEGDSLSVNRIVPVYPATEGITQKRLRRITDAVLRGYLSRVEDVLPPDTVSSLGLVGAREAYANIHYPSDMDALRAARYRLVFEQFLVLQVGLVSRKHAQTVGTAGCRFDVDLDALRTQLRSVLPFELTGAQRRAIGDIARDVSSGHPMNRLLQGDVGSGKTLVAVATILMAHASGYQAALMAPTEVLAQQHYLVLRRLLEPLGVTVGLATGSQNQSEREEIRTGLALRQVDVAVGTHALIQDDVEFANLGLAVIDEQQRFGVLQRQALHRKGVRPHVLVMTATPIPRTLNMTLYGDLDTSVMDEMPPGRRPVRTHWKHRAQADEVYGAVATLLARGQQAYVVCPLVEESEKLEAAAASQLAERIQRDLLPEYRVGLLHGQMRPDERAEVMRQFQAREIDVLVSTTVIEVGVDVKNASVMVIEDADRFGLSQLHQLRGRVGRGENASYCILLSDPKTDDAVDRLQVMVETQDGFRIAEEDLRLRGPGEIFGTRQSGMPEFFVGDVLADRDVMEVARREALRLVEADPRLEQPDHRALRRAAAESRVGFDLVHVG